MDITLLQIQNGKTSELLQLKKEIVGYLYNKKFSTKSITLVKTLKLIDKETVKRKNENICTDENLTFSIIPDKNLKKLEDTPVFICNNQTRISVPDFLQDSSNASSIIPILNNCLNLYNYDKSDIDLIGKKRGSENSVFPFDEDKTTYTSSCNKSESDVVTYSDNDASTVTSKEKENEKSVVNDSFSENASAYFEITKENTPLKHFNQSNELYRQLKEDNYFNSSFRNTFKYNELSDLNLNENFLSNNGQVNYENYCNNKISNCKITKREKSNNDLKRRPIFPENEVCLQLSNCNNLNEVYVLPISREVNEKEEIIRQKIGISKPIQKILKSRKKVNQESNMPKNELNLFTC
jgi:hypothetical protein